MREKAERFFKYMELKGLNDNQVTRNCDLSQGLLGQARSGKSDLGTKAIDKILKYYQDLNRVWLLTGEGEMLVQGNNNDERQDVKNTDKESDYVLVIPSRAMGGSLAEFANSVHEYDCERAVSPIKGADYIITVTGYSMEPEYPNGSKVVIKKINERAFIDWGRTYVLDTCNGAVIKNIMPGSSSDCVKCVSVNPQYPEFEVQFSDMNGMYRVMMLMCEK